MTVERSGPLGPVSLTQLLSSGSGVAGMVGTMDETRHDALWYAWGHIDGGNYPAEFDSAYGFAFRDWYNARRAAYYRGESGLIAGMIEMWHSFAAGGRTDFGN